MLKNYKCSPAQIVLLLMCVFVVRPYYVQIFSAANDIWAYLTLLFAAASCVLAFVYRKEKEIGLVLIFAIIYIIATLLNESHNILSVVSTVCQIVLGFNIGVLAFSGECVDKKVDVIRFVTTIYLYLYIICGFLDVSVRFFGQYDTITFFGYDNYAAFIVLPLMAIKWSLDSYQTGCVLKRDWLCWGLCLLYNLKLRSFTIIAVLCLFVVVYLFVRYFREIRKIIKPWVAFVLIVLFLVGIVRFQMQYLAAGILEALGKGVTLNSRTWIWDRTITAIFQRPILGQGYLSEGSFQWLINIDPADHPAASHGHNIILDILICTGFVGLICFGILLFQQVRAARKHLANKEIYLLLTGLFLFLLLGTFDGYPFIATFYLMISLLGSIPRYDKKEEV